MRILMQSQEDDFDKAVERFLSHCKSKNLSGETISTYRNKLNQFGIFLDSSRVSLSDINAKTIDGYIIWLRENRNCNDITVNSYLRQIKASPVFYGKNDEVVSCLKESFPMSGLSISDFLMCDARNKEIINRLPQMDVLILAGGHVPSQNAFMRELQLKEKLVNGDGLLIAWSAGSMNCAEDVYAGPELPGEAIDPDYKRWIKGLGITKTNIFPHFEQLKDEVLDGMRLIEDITYSDSMGHEIIALNNGSYIVAENGVETLYGEAYSIKDGVQKQICTDGEWIRLV